jgi:hypothetical protein
MTAYRIKFLVLFSRTLFLSCDWQRQILEEGENITGSTFGGEKFCIYNIKKTFPKSVNFI